MPREEPCWLLENNIKDISKKFERLRDLETWWCNSPANSLKAWVPQQEQRLDKTGNRHEKEWVVFISEWWGLSQSVSLAVPKPTWWLRASSEA